VPYYLKIDIEGGELPFLGSMLGSMELPTFISVECHAFAPIESLFAIGYRRFKLVNQTILYALPVPNPALEGIYVPDPDWRHASGPFGRELPGDWFDLAGIALQFDAIMRMKSLKTIIHPHVWFDCHAWQV
jgi:hypothetical protein